MFKKLFYAAVVVVDLGLAGYSIYQCWFTHDHLWVLWLAAALFFMQEVNKDA